MGPFDYSSAFASVRPHDAMMKGIGEGMELRKAEQARQQEEAAALAMAQMNADLAALAQNPTTAGIAALSVKYPTLSENFKRSYDMLQPKEQQARLEQALPVYAALHKNQPEVARKTLLAQAEAYRNSGREDEARAAEAKAKVIEQDPVAAKINLGGLLAAVIGPEKWATISASMGEEQRAEEQAPAKLREAEAKADEAGYKASSAGVDAKYAENVVLADLEKKGWDIRKIQSDIETSRESNRIAAMNAQYNREGNELKRQELRAKIDAAKTERDDKVREKVSKVEGAVAAMDNMLNTVERLLKNPELDDVLGSIEGRIPGVSDGESDAVALIDTLGSQAFLSQVPNIQGMGALSNAEGEKLQAALQNFSRSQSEAQFKANLKEVQRIVKKGRESVSKRYGVPIGAPDTPAAPAPAAAIPAGWSVEQN